MRYFAEISFAGTNFHGWQIQPNAITVQEILNKHFTIVLGENINLTGAGRTDTGVHAFYYMAHFDSIIEKLDEDPRFLIRINGFLPPDIAVHAIYPVLPDAHARFDALSRSYEYYISRKKNPFLQSFSMQYTGYLDITSMKQACDPLLTQSDFSCFCKKGSDQNSTECSVYEAYWSEKDHLLIFRIKANRFLRNMVRAIVGTHLVIGKGKMTMQEYHKVIEAGSRSAAGESVPGSGLSLCNIQYPDQLFTKLPPPGQNIPQKTHFVN